MAQKKIYDDYIDTDWFGWYDIQDSTHITDSYGRALAVADELLRNLV